MADRYWVGGTANWDGTAGTKWAATSGGAGGQSVPTSADDVFFTNLSTGTVTIATGNTGAKSINCTGFTGTIAGALAAISVAGSVTLSAGMTYTHTGTMTFTGTGTLTTAGKTFSGVTVDGSGITVTLGDALNISTRTITVTQGTFSTANYNVTASSISSAGDLTRAIQLGSSTVTVSSGAAFSISGSNVTFNAGTSQINHPGNFVTLSATIPLTFHNYSFTTSGSGTRTILSAQTFNNLTLVASSAGVTTLSLGGDQTINGTLTCAGSSFSSRGYVRSAIAGTARTLTAAVISADNCDFEDIALAGAASPASPAGAGNCGGNTGITFSAAKTVYRVGTDTTWAGSSSWATSSGGTGSDANFPLAQDTIIVDEATTGTSLSIVGHNRGVLDMSSRTSAYTLTAGAGANFYGSFTLGSGITTSGTSRQDYRGRGTSTLVTAGKTISFTMGVTAAGTLQLGDAFTSSTTFVLSEGTFDAAGYNVTVNNFNTSNTNVRTLSMGSGLWTLTGTSGSLWNAAIPTNLTINKGTADILLSSTATTTRSLSGGGVALNKLTIGGATGTSTTNLSNVNVTELASTKPVAHTIAVSEFPLTVGTWSVTGTSGNVVTFNSNTAGTQRTLALTNVTSGIDYLAVQDIAVSDANKFYVGANSTDSGNNVNVYFTVPPVVPAGQNVFRQVFRPVFREIFRPIF